MSGTNNRKKIVRAIIKDNDNYLLFLRAPDPHNIHDELKNKYELVGGKLQPEEDVFAAMEREIMEEIGCKVDKISLFTHIIFDDLNEYYFDVNLLDEIKPNPEDFVLDGKYWFSAKEIKGLYDYQFAFNGMLYVLKEHIRLDYKTRKNELVYD